VWVCEHPVQSSPDGPRRPKSWTLDLKVTMIASSVPFMYNCIFEQDLLGPMRPWAHSSD
jgi:hypothetical protein